MYSFRRRKKIVFKINLFAFFFYLFAVPPQKPKIFDEKGKEVPSVAGPYEEGGDMRLTCFVTGGK